MPAQIMQNFKFENKDYKKEEIKDSDGKQDESEVDSDYGFDDDFDEEIDDEIPDEIGEKIDESVKEDIPEDKTLLPSEKEDTIKKSSQKNESVGKQQKDPLNISIDEEIYSDFDDDF